MRRLFLRFYIAVICILAAAWALQSWLYGKRMGPRYAELIRSVYFGGIRIARQKYLFGESLERSGDQGARERLFSEIKEQYDFPVSLHEENPHWDFDLHLCRGIDHGLGEGTFIMARLRPGRKEVLLFGPLPQPATPANYEVALGIGTVLAGIAIAIGFLLRPVLKQFQAVEGTAQQIAAGDLSARIDKEGRVGSSQLAGAFNNMADRTETMLRTQKELLQAVSHELRTPLSRIHFAIDLIRTANDQEREQKLEALELAADDLDNIVGELITYVRMENAPTCEPTDVELAATIESIFEKQDLLTPNIQLEKGPGVTADLTLAVDAASFDRAIQNLLSNAAKYSTSHVRVDAARTDDAVVIDIDDDGPGVPEADRERVFDPFVRLSGASGTGVGLGLAIVRRIARRHGGSIEILDSPLGGCRVRTTWPV